MEREALKPQLYHWQWFWESHFKVLERMDKLELKPETLQEMCKQCFDEGVTFALEKMKEE